MIAAVLAIMVVLSAPLGLWSLMAYNIHKQARRRCAEGGHLWDEDMDGRLRCKQCLRRADWTTR